MGEAGGERVGWVAWVADFLPELVGVMLRVVRKRDGESCVSSE